MKDLMKAKRVEARALAASPVVEEEKPSVAPEKAVSGWFARLMLKYYFVACVASYVFVALLSGEWGIKPEFLFANSIAAPVVALLIGAVETGLADEEHRSWCLLIAAAVEFVIGAVVSVLMVFVPNTADLWVGAQIAFMFGALMAGWWLVKKVFW